MTQENAATQAPADEIPDADTPSFEEVQLSYPRRIDGKAYREVRLRHPTAGDMISAYAKEADPTQRARQMLVALSGVPATHLDRLHAFDYLKLNEVVQGFLFNGPKRDGQT